MIKRILSRINGPIRDNYRQVKLFKNKSLGDTVAETLYKSTRNSYRYGRFARRMNEKLFEQFYNNEHEYFDIMGFKCTVLNYVIFFELCDLWFPYFHKNWDNKLSTEGTYEQFDVMLEEGM